MTVLERPTCFDVERIRADFPILKLKVNGKPLVFLDNAASSQMPQPVIDRLVRYQTTRARQHPPRRSLPVGDGDLRLRGGAPQGAARSSTHAKTAK